MSEPDDDDPFVDETLALLRAESLRAEDDRVAEMLRRAPRPSAAPRTRRAIAVRYALTALAAAALAAVITYALTRDDVRTDDAFALGGGVPGSPAVPDITRDPQGRPSEIARRVAGRLEGERVLFRAGQVMRIERYHDGQLDGPALDFDGLGRLVALHTFAAGRERGPYLELAPDGTLRASGQR